MRIRGSRARVQNDSRIGNRRRRATDYERSFSLYEGNVVESAILILNDIATSSNDNAPAPPGIQPPGPHQSTKIPAADVRGGVSRMNPARTVERGPNRLRPRTLGASRCRTPAQAQQNGIRLHRRQRPGHPVPAFLGADVRLRPRHPRPARSPGATTCAP